MSKEEKRGGLRNPVGGRPTIPESEKRQVHSICFDPSNWDWLQSVHGRRKNDFLNALLSDYIQNKLIHTKKKVN